jgi:hypothetical protein
MEQPKETIADKLARQGDILKQAVNAPVAAPVDPKIAETRLREAEEAKKRKQLAEALLQVKDGVLNDFVAKMAKEVANESREEVRKEQEAAEKK